MTIITGHGLPDGFSLEREPLCRGNEPYRLHKDGINLAIVYQYGHDAFGTHDKRSMGSWVVTWVAAPDTRDVIEGIMAKFRAEYQEAQERERILFYAA